MPRHIATIGFDPTYAGYSTFCGTPITASTSASPLEYLIKEMIPRKGIDWCLECMSYVIRQNCNLWQNQPDGEHNDS